MARTYLLQINGPGGVAPELPRTYSSPVVSAYLPSDGPFQYHFPFRAPDGTIWDVFSKPDPSESLPTVQEWDYQRLNLGGNTDGPSAVMGPWVGTYSDQQHFVYLAPDGTLWDSFYVNGSNNWHLQHINNGGATSGPPASGDFVSIWTDPTGEQQHFTYLGRDRNIYDAFWDGDQNNWHFQHINSGGAVAPPAAGPPFACTFSMQQHIAYIDDSGKVWDCWYDGFGTWSAQLLNDGGRTTLPLGRGGDNLYPWVWRYGAFEQHFSYLGADGAVFDAYWDSQRWHATQLTHANAADFAKTNALAQVCRPSVTVYSAARHTFVMDSQGIIRDCWLDTGWELTQINGPDGLFPHCLPATGLPFAWSTQAILGDGDGADGGENSSASVAWSDRNGTIWSAAVDSMPEQMVSV